MSTLMTDDGLAFYDALEVNDRTCFRLERGRSDRQLPPVCDRRVRTAEQWYGVPAAGWRVEEQTEDAGEGGVNVATGIFVGPVSVVLAELAQSAWNFQRFKLLVPKFRKKLGDPVGGAVVPSTSAGSNPPKLVLSWKHCCVAAVPSSIADRLKAQTFEPANVCPLFTNEAHHTRARKNRLEQLGENL